MRVIRKIEEIDLKKTFRCCVAIGNFDGVHKGHKFLLHKLKEISEKNNIPTVVFSFYNHPLIFINNLKKYYITLPEEKIEILSSLGIDYLFCPDFDKEFMNMRTIPFIEFLKRHFSPEFIVVGENFNFGFGREGNPESLKKNFDGNTIVVEPIKYENENISSSRIRNCLRDGDVKEVKELCGYYYSITGTVVSGNKLGNRLGVPTLNIDMTESTKIVPKKGVYATYTTIDNVVYPGITNIGGAPTIDHFRRDKIETYVFDKELKKMYNEKIKVQFIDFLRDEKKFDNLEILKENMFNDMKKAKKILKSLEGE